ncbi:Mitochodrial transcription termination factor [Nannochloropsis gaditana]|uniref:Mitochodrial transcription termination factor n=1 Tax=Nannochloropsis gaditana TaxID=72520 RepID=W7TWK8_9STRA|nr:Mitochodrial transcription termination factor [Nannochloropsis gaditana]
MRACHLKFCAFFVATLLRFPSGFHVPTPQLATFKSMRNQYHGSNSPIIFVTKDNDCSINSQSDPELALSEVDSLQRCLTPAEMEDAKDASDEWRRAELAKSPKEAVERKSDDKLVSENRGNSRGLSGKETAWDQFIEILEPTSAPTSSASTPSAKTPAATTRYYMKTPVPYYFLRDELGVSESNMLRISLDHGQVLALSVERNLRPKVAWLRTTLRLTQPEAAALVGSSPGLLLLSIEDNLAPKLSWLQEDLGLAFRDRRNLIVRCPQILTTSTGSLLMKLAFFQDDLGMSQADVQKALRLMPALLMLSLDTLMDKVEFLIAAFSIEITDVGSLLVRAPALFFQSIEDGLKPKARFLRRDLGLDPPDMASLLRRMPRALNYNVVRRGRPFLQYLTGQPLNLSKEEVARMVLRSPSLLSTDVGSPRFLHLMDALQGATGLPPGPAFASLLQRFPMVLSFTAARLQASLDVLVRDLGCDAGDVALVLQKHPQLVGYRPEAVRLKLSLLRDVYGLEDLGAAKPAVLKAPALVSYSLDTRLRPRLEMAAAAGVPLERAVTWLPLTEAKFEERVGRSSTQAISLTDTPLLRQRPNARLRKILRTPKAVKGALLP